MNTPARAALAAVLALAGPGLASAQGCPDYSPNARSLSLTQTAQSLWTPQRQRGVAGGDFMLSGCRGVSGYGYFSHYPDYSMRYDAMNLGRGLEFRVEARCDTILLVNGTNAEWYWNDDTNGNNPRIRINNARSGRYDIWVGTFQSAMCDAELVVETF